LIGCLCKDIRDWIRAWQPTNPTLSNKGWLLNTLIRRKVLDRIGDGSVLSRIFDPSLLDIAASSFTNQVDIVLEEEVLKAKASPYAKRW
jgi:hypothetical protein